MIRVGGAQISRAMRDDLTEARLKALDGIMGEPAGVDCPVSVL